MIETNSDVVLMKKIKLKDYIDECINETSEDYINVSHDEKHNIIDTTAYIRKYRNMFLCIKEICQNRNKF